MAGRRNARARLSEVNIMRRRGENNNAPAHNPHINCAATDMRIARAAPCTKTAQADKTGNQKRISIAGDTVNSEARPLPAISGPRAQRTYQNSNGPLLSQRSI